MQIIKKQLSDRVLTYFKSVESPTAKTLLFLHGFPDTPHVFRHQFEHFNRGHNILAPYAPGTDGEKLSRVPSLDEIARDYLKMLEQEELDDVTIVAHDLGGPVAGRMAQLNPDLVKKIILINSTTVEQFYFRKKYPSQMLKSYYMLFFQAPQVTKRLMKLGWNRLQKKILEDNHIHAPENYQETTVLEGMHLYKSFARELPQLISGPRKKLATPVHLIFAEDDNYLNPPTREELEETFDQSTLKIIPGHHWLPLEKASEVNRLIQEKL